MKELKAQLLTLNQNDVNKLYDNYARSCKELDDTIDHIKSLRNSINNLHGYGVTPKKLTNTEQKTEESLIKLINDFYRELIIKHQQADIKFNKFKDTVNNLPKE